ncbi:hypothetical protein ACEZDB_27400 [Streptacidiphilus sp. N1-3]|uniref:Uncharacterized protein n=1 Tax=Streptacidiphilus alkalitolerans TaxID=3342712 RepID=A0ABV6X7W0_9ACTN
MTISQAQLDGEACVVCGASEGFLIPAGYFFAPDGGGGRRSWAVVACPKERRPKL